MTVRSSALRMCSAAMLLALGLSFNETGPSAQSGQTVAAPPSADAQRCAALAAEDFEGLPDAPTRISSARLVDVPPADPQSRPAFSPQARSSRYCQVLGYVAPQNKFELRLPLPAQWNQRFHLTPCAGFCGGVNGNACNLTLARGYASITGNGGHDGGPGFDGVWAANNPNLQEDFAWRHNHVITIAGKAITTKFYGQPIARSYMSGCSKGGHAVADGGAALPRGLRRVVADRSRLRSDRPRHGRRVGRAGGCRRSTRLGAEQRRRGDRSKIGAGALRRAGRRGRRTRDGSRVVRLAAGNDRVFGDQERVRVFDGPAGRRCEADDAPRSQLEGRGRLRVSATSRARRRSGRDGTTDAAAIRPRPAPTRTTSSTISS